MSRPKSKPQGVRLVKKIPPVPRRRSGRNHQLKVLLSTDEKGMLHYLASQCGLTVSDFLRTEIRSLFDLGSSAASATRKGKVKP